jgi:hypothetical protein
MKKIFESGNWKIGRNIKTVGEYEGEVKEGKRHGLGKIIHKNGEVVYGIFRDGIFYGPGVYNYANGDIYEGEFK